MKLYATPFVPFGGGPIVIAGGGGEVVMLEACVALSEVSVDADTGPVTVPGAVGSAVIPPSRLRVDPVRHA